MNSDFKITRKSSLINFLSYFICITFVSISLLYLFKLRVVFEFVNFSILIPAIVLGILFFRYINIKLIIFNCLLFFNKLNNLSKKNISLLSILITVLFGLSSIVLHYYNITTLFYEKKSYFFIYCFLKIIFTLGILFSVFHFGYIFTSHSSKNYKYTTRLIIYLSVGSIALSLLGTIMGLIGLLYYNLIIIFFLTLTLFSKKMIKEIINKENISSNMDIKYNFYISILVLSLAILFVRTLFPFTEDGDVWGHYFNFYNSISDNHNIFDRNYWQHFAQLKGHGLGFFATVLSDIFAPQQVSFIYLLLIFLIIYDVGTDIIKNNIIIGIVALAICSYGISIDNDIMAISLMKPHIVFNSFYLLTFWFLYKSSLFGLDDKKIIFLSYVVLFFVGFSHHFFSFIIFLTLVLLTITFSITSKKKFKLFCIAIIALCSGVFLSLLINYLVLGMPEAAFAKTIWPIFDQNKFLDKIGYKAILFTLVEGDSIKNNHSFSYFISDIKNILFAYTLSIFRSGYSILLYLLIFIFLFLNNKKKYLKIYASIFLAFFTIVFMIYFFDQPSFKRGVFFINILMLMIFTISILGFLKLSSNKINNIFQVFFIVPIVFFFTFFVHKNFKKNLEFYKSFYDGKSFQQILLKCDSEKPYQVDCQNFKFISKIKNKYEYSALYSLSQTGGYSSTLPRPGIIVEPYFNKSLNFNNFTYQNNEDIFKEFKAIDIDYFIVNLKTSNDGMFLNRDFIKKYLTVIDSSNQIYFLKLKKEKLPNLNDEYFSNIMDLKLSYLINYIFSKEFKRKSSALTKRDITDSILDKTICVNSYNKNIIIKALKAVTKNTHSLSTSAEVIDNIHDEIIANVKKSYNLKYSKSTTMASLSVIGSLQINPSDISKKFNQKNNKKECYFF